MKALNPGVHKVAPDQRVIIKSQRRIDNGPFVRFSCWHCPDPPCVKRCPFNALTKQPNGAVSIDPDLCDPSQCDQQCLRDCKRAGYPKIGVGSDLFATEKAWKCTLCYGRSGAEADLDPKYGDPLPRNFRNNNNLSDKNGVLVETVTSVPELEHEPSCVYTCPAKAMKWGTRDEIRAYINDGALGAYKYHDEGEDWFISAQGDGSMYWASKKVILIQPKADPFIEDHVTPMMSNLLTGPFAKAALVPTLLAGGLLAVIARRQANMEESAGMREG
jgi:Fe-S-cluster-containing dehydrogenase component